MQNNLNIVDGFSLIKCGRLFLLRLDFVIFVTRKSNSMKKGSLLVFFIFACFYNSPAQTFTDSNLPIVIINTDGGVDIGNNDVLGDMKVIYRGPGQRNFVIDQDSLQYLNYDGRITIRIRGSSTEVLQKKQYNVTTIKADNITNNNVVLLGLPSDNDWIYNAMGYDPALIRDYLCYNLSRQIGEYASRTVYCELIINNAFKGLYDLQEKIKQGKDRVNIMKMAATDNNLPNISGGYIVKADKTTGGDPVAWTMPSYVIGQDITYINDYPKPEDVTLQQIGYIESVFQQLASTAHSGDTTLERGYPAVIDIPSFVDYMIISELSSNADSYQYSTYFHKDRNGKLRAGPIWDNDLTFGNDLFFWGLNRSHTDVWQFANGDNEGSKFWSDLFNNMNFRCSFYKRWQALTQPGAPLNYSSISNFIDQTVTWISEAVARNRAVWSTIDVQYNPDPTDDYSTDIAKVKSFIQTRISWITNYLQSSTFGCPDRTMPPMVITKINYNPLPTVTVTNGQYLEFIELTNMGTKTVDLAGDYFLGTGIVYQFPMYSYILPGAVRIIASNSYAFKLTYGFQPNDQFTRNLSNEGEQLVLADRFGDTIDYVNYSSLPPWPDANGNGKYLQVIDPSRDNNDPSNWTATGKIIDSDPELTDYDGLAMFPNPATELVHFSMPVAIKIIQLFNIEGKMLISVNPGRNEYDLDISAFSAGIYYIRIISATDCQVKKLIIQ